MAGPREKQGLDYFPHDVDLSIDEKIQLLEADQGLIGYAVFCKLLEKIYRNGYYLKADERFLKLLSKNLTVEFTTCKNILDTCIEEHLFNKKIYKSFEILTSKGIQTRYLEAVKRRKKIDLIQEYLLINVNGNDENVNIISINVSDNAQRREEKRREEKENIFELPEWFPLKEWETFLSHRKGMKYPIPPESYEKVIKKFEKLKAEGWEPEKVVDTMIEKGWRWFKPEWVKEDKESDWSRRLRQSD